MSIRKPKKLNRRSPQSAEVDGAIESRRILLFDRTSNTRFLIDTGSDVSIIPATNRDRAKGASKFDLHAANGSRIKVYDKKVVTTDLGLRRRFNWNFLVADVGMAIIGADFLAAFGIVVDLKHRRLIDGVTKLTSVGGLTEAAVHSVTVVATDHPFRDLLTQFHDVTLPTNMRTTINHDVTHHIQTKGPPTASKCRRLAPDKLEAAKKEFQVMSELGICRPSSSSWASPLHCVQKKNGQWRFVGDYRSLNQVTVPDRYPVPHIHDLLNAFQGKSVFTTLDLERAYHQIPVEETDIPKTAVITPFGLFEFTRMQFGLCNASQTFQRFMHQVFSDLDFVVVFVDDICIASSSLEEHYMHVRMVLERLNAYGLVINVSKSHFAQKTVDFLGYSVSKDGILPLPDRVKAVTDFTLPSNVKQLRRFLALVNCYKRFLPQATDIQSALRNLIPGNKKNESRKLEWTEQARAAFVQCKESLASATLLHYPDATKPLSLLIDASSTAAGAVLQQFDSGCWRPLGFYSEKFSQSQQKYSTFGRELTAMKMSVQYFRHMLEGRQFVIFTDHKPLTTALTSNPNSRLPHEDRYLRYISEFTNDIRHISGQNNVTADALSRIEAVTVPSPIDYEQIASEQINDSELQRLLCSHTGLKLELRQTPLASKPLYCDISHSKVRPYIPPQYRQLVLQTIHGLAHPGIRTTRRLVTDRFVWTNINKDVQTYVKSCLQCQRSKVHRHTKAPFEKFVVPNCRFRHVHIDLVGPLPPSNGNRYLLTAVDRFSRWPEAIALPDMTAETVARALCESWISRFGAPETITTDQGRQFESDLFRELSRIIGFKHSRTTAYHPQANGLVERFHRTMKSAIMAVDSKHWCDHLPMIMLGLRAACREDFGCSAAELVYGQTLRLPGEYFERSSCDSDRTDFAKQLRNSLAKLKPVDPNHHAKPAIFVNRDLDKCTHVFVRIDAVKKPLVQPYEGPFKIVSRYSKFMDILVNGKTQRISIDRIKPAYTCDLDIDPNSVNDRKTVVTPSGHRVRFLV